MAKVLAANAVLTVQLDKGISLLPMLPPLQVQSTGIIDMANELVVEADLEQFLTQNFTNIPYINPPFVNGFVSFASISSIELAEKTIKKGDPVVLVSDIKCSVTAIPAINPGNGQPDSNPPTEVTLSSAAAAGKIDSA
ncbi:hypothetical protein [Gynuella sunshinyii]|uniref:Uncharacterized protein n=1 Tax=Gynuella sunshinyii YC6258 TaxID=1445510 RepID=A0A0C5VV42_9GAMM|nr:hypothetical protein [Gynuella sunshinyii]AJQ94244.1 hypothetical Protein YC6258_02206 [Gynuella sunshinyii YC6258]